MTLRGKLNLPEFRVVFDGEDGKVYEGNTDLENKIVDTLAHMALISCEIAKNDEKKSMDIYADIVSMLYKLPMFISYAPTIKKEDEGSKERKGNYVPTAFEYFFIYTIARHLTDITVDKNTSLKDIFEKLENFEHTDTLRSLIRLYFPSLREIYEALINTPADTRPGFNFTSLASHLQLTSLISWLLQPHSIDLSYLRVASLLHDLGKLINPRHHVTEAINILEKLQNKLKSGEACIKLERVKELVASHHGDSESIVQIADRLASSADRLTELVNEALDHIEYGKEIKECFNKEHEQSYDCFTNLGKEKYEKASKDIYRFILSKVISPEIVKNEEARVFPFIPDKVEGSSKEIKPGIPLGYLVYIDVPSIQRFITNFPKLRDMSFASMLVDFLVTVYPFMLLDTEFASKTKSRLPAEALLSGYGGHSYIVVRKDICNNDCYKEIKDIFKGIKLLSDLDLRLQVSVAEFAYDNYIKNYNEVWDEIKTQFSERYLVDFDEKIYSVGLHRVCDNCGIRPAVYEKFGEYLCSRCYEIRDLSSTRGFISKVNSTYLLSVEVTPAESASKVFGDNFAEYAMEFIAGYKKLEDTRYVSIIKADGNRGSIIFSASATFSDYIDKSFRLDYGVKRAFYETLNELANAEREFLKSEEKELPLTSRVLSGVLYLGGDDITLLAPSIVAIPFAVKFFEKATQLTGFTFKVGIVSVKPDHPIQFAFQAADELMERSKIKPEDGENKNLSEYNKTSIACMVFSSTLASKSVIHSEISKYKRQNNSYLVVTNDIRKVKELLELAKLYEFKDVVSLYNSENDKKEVREKLRQLEDIVSYAETNFNTSNGYLKTLAYILRQIARSDKPYDKEILKKLVERKEGSLKEIPLYDYYFILKTFRVGVG
ncbi:HD domain-containing protein [Sulfurisphaera ohwakuensis]|uniref:HD domain-containing protein n=1 Tax=Sulfurisphaera ohwakuensis TaxID=69656 RepID=UPI0036F1EB01